MKNRDMYYQNLNQGYQNPGGMIPPSGYNMNANYQAFGPNVMPNQGFQPNMNQYQPNMNQYQPNMNQYQTTQSYEDYVEERLDKVDRQIKNLDTRLQKIETTSTTTDNIYMI